ncbi:glycosyl hydrolase [Niveibacterium sp. SC-1]|uniref:glycosyl hydrolase n=1 Tax=Niveibacterium sp. SC-1 TaxID=3135646 RepID=UPI00311D537A
MKPSFPTASLPSGAVCGVRRLALAALIGTSFLLSACGGGGESSSSPSNSTTAPTGSAGSGTDVGTPAGGAGASTPVATTPTGTTDPDNTAVGSTPKKSAKRGIAYDLAAAADFSALAPGVSWWYDWGLKPNTAAPADAHSRYAMDFLPMLWNGSFDDAGVETFLKANPSIKYLLVLNEPNLVDQANTTPQQAAQLWPRYEAIAAHTGVKIVGPAITWGTMSGYSDPVQWLDAFYAAYRTLNGNRDPQIDYLAFHWYDYGLAGQLDRLKKYGKSFWVTEFANWHNGDGSAQIDSVAKQKVQMQEMVATCEGRADVFRYAWFTGRWSNDSHYTSLLGASGQLTELGQYYLSLPYAQ